MIEQYSNITAANWSFSLAGFGQVVQNSDEINQTIGVILATQKGSDPFRPTFGSDIWDYIDKPLPVAGPNMVRAIVDAIDRWEPRVKITSITYEYQSQFGDNTAVLSGIVFSITWQLIGGTEQELIDLLVNMSSSPTGAKIVVLSTESGDVVSTEDDHLIQIE